MNKMQWAIGALVISAALWYPTRGATALVTIDIPSDCSSLLGAWRQTDFGQDRSSHVVHGNSNAADLVIHKISQSCELDASFNGNGYTHEVHGTVGKNAGSGEMTIDRTDPSGCKSQLYGSIYELLEPVLGYGYNRKLAWRITSASSGCGVPADWYEDRWWTHR